MTPLKPDTARPDFSQNISDLSEAQHIKVNLKTGQLEKTTAFQAFIEKCKRLLGLTDSTNKDLLAHKIYVYLENNRDFISPNLNKIKEAEEKLEKTQAIIALLKR